MVSMTDLLLSRAENELVTATKLKEMSENSEIQKFMEIPPNMTFYSSVISHSYYAIFYAAKAILYKEGIKTDKPNVHQKTLHAFNKFLVKTGKLDKALLEIYEDIVIKAEALLDIFSKEKGKRGEFTYETLPQANEEPAKTSLDNAKLFVSNIKKVIEKD